MKRHTLRSMRGRLSDTIVRDAGREVARRVSRGWQQCVLCGAGRLCVGLGLLTSLTSVKVVKLLGGMLGETRSAAGEYEYPRIYPQQYRYFLGHWRITIYYSSPHGIFKDALTHTLHPLLLLLASLKSLKIIIILWQVFFFCVESFIHFKPT